MLGLKVPLKDAEKWKQFITINNLMDKRYYYKKDKNHIYFPVTSKFMIVNSSNPSIKNTEATDNSIVSFIEMEFPKSANKGTLRENLSKMLTPSELAFVKTGHDIIGSIAILEIPKGLEKREKLIAETLLEVNSQIKTVLKKADIHGGTFRTQKMTYLAGINTKETTYKENNVQLKLDVEKVYFSIRLGNERKRISTQVKPREEILVMFSGCAPYPIVLSKNTKARHITGIEINPDGHMYGMENLRLNKVHNVLLINDDVHHAIPNIYQKIVGLKSALHNNEMELHLKKNPQIVEIHLFNDSLDDDKIKQLEKNIVELKNKGLEVFFHMPFKMNGEFYNLDNDDSIDFCRKAGELCKKYFVSVIVHLCSECISNGEAQLIQKVKNLEEYYDYFYFENLGDKSFSEQEDLLRISRKAGFKNICLDLAHLYSNYTDHKKIASVIKTIQKEFNTYFHVNDHDAKNHGLEIGKGVVDFDLLLPFVNKGVVEVESKDESKPVEHLNSYDTLKNYHNKTYDRIIMPLPKSADEFLEDALAVSKKGTVIHFYDFLEVSKFDEAAKKIDKACKSRGMKYKILEVVKCGQHAPYVFRICVDFVII